VPLNFISGSEVPQGRTSVSHTRESIPDPSSASFPASVHPLEISRRTHYEIPPEYATDPSDAYHTSIDPCPSLSTVFRHSGWSRDRDRVYHALRRTRQSASRLSAFARCGSSIRVMQSTENPSCYRLAGSYCHDRVCLPCANARSRTIAMNLVNAIPKGRSRFLTLTLQHENESLVHLLTKLQRSFSRLQKSKLWRARVAGGAAFLEVKRSSLSDSWHVHYHALVVGRYVPQAELSQAWYNITGDSTIVDIRSAGGPEAVSRYITKYASKPINPDFIREPDLLAEAIVALRRRRLCQTFGTLRGVALTDEPTDEAWATVDTLDNLLLRERDGDEEAAKILAVLRSDGLDDARHCLRSRPPPPARPTENRTTQLAFRDLDPEPWSRNYVESRPAHAA